MIDNAPRRALIVSGLHGKLAILRIECAKCGRAGRYNVAKLPPGLRLTDWLSQLTADCPRRIADRYKDQCGAVYPDLPKVF